jgi:hypothetical protein
MKYDIFSDEKWMILVFSLARCLHETIFAFLKWLTENVAKAFAVVWCRCSARNLDICRLNYPFREACVENSVCPGDLTLEKCKPLFCGYTWKMKGFCL